MLPSAQRLFEPLEPGAKSGAEALFDLRRARRVDQRIPGLLVADAAHERGERLEVVQGQIERRGDDKKQVHGSPVGGVIGNAGPRDAQGNEDPWHSFNAAVGDGNTVSESRGLLALAGNHGFFQLFAHVDGAKDGRTPHQFSECFELVGAAQVRDDGAGFKTMMHSHSVRTGAQYTDRPGEVSIRAAILRGIFPSLYNIGAAIYSDKNAAVCRIREHEWEGKTVAKAQAKKAATKVPDKLTSASLIGYLAEKNGLVRRDVKQVLEDLFEIVGAGVMRGERVALGKIGKMFVRVRPARAAHSGRNPLTGQEIMIPAKPATKVPRFTFSKTFKEAALKAKARK